ncbi:hypothetical protein J5N97_022024 [Dioscorea zingiberensis]|uniref:Uncharacterized protein n=1 Tax=Dioscorea zingiberensis TaxID=325984 RepID=A0A9D5CAP2_9LILI|nr:hypothetical protein J5N97_022024 [Dioscorea zingiberensis]
MTTVAMTAAPLALPPVCILTVLSLTVSIPFGVLVATVAATEKLMSTLLPLPVQLQQQEAPDEEEDDEVVLVETPVMETTLDEGLLYKEEKVWEEINGIRTVVGYNAGLQEGEIIK